MKATEAAAERRKFVVERRMLLALSVLAAALPGAHGAVMGKDIFMDSTGISEAVTAYADAWRRGDLGAMQACYHSGFTLHYPGDHALAGTHSGKVASLKVLVEVARRTNRALVEIVSVMAGPGRGAIVARERWHNSVEEAIVERVLVYAAVDGLLHDCWLFDADQKTVARFLDQA